MYRLRAGENLQEASQWLLFLFADELIGWSMNQQTVVAQSSKREDLLAFSVSLKEAFWIKNFP